MKLLSNENEDESGKMTKLESRSVIKGYIESHYIYYSLTQAPVSRMKTLIMMISLEVEWQLKNTPSGFKYCFTKFSIEIHRICKHGTRL